MHNPSEKRWEWGAGGRFIKLALQHQSDECLLWPFAVGNNGYGAVWHGGRVTTSHRAVCVDAHGEPPPGHNDAAHSCGVRTCCNPRHLRWATRSENNMDKVRHGTHDRGSRHVKSKLTEAEVSEIHRLAGTVSKLGIAKRFGVCSSVVDRILKGKAWPHMHPERQAA